MSSFVQYVPNIAPAEFLCIILVLWVLATSMYRLYSSPIARFPGPRLAALTSWYEFYFDAVKEGQFTSHLQGPHKKYGPFIRIIPTELYIDDPEYYETIYSHSLHLDKMESFSHRWNSPGAMQSTASHEIHRHRYAALSSFFSNRQVLLLWPYILEKWDKLWEKIDEGYCGTGRPLRIGEAFGCFALDVITAYAFEDSFDELDKEGFQ